MIWYLTKDTDKVDKLNMVLNKTLEGIQSLKNKTVNQDTAIELLARHLPKAGTQSVTRRVARA
jgi:hypothetical protein